MPAFETLYRQYRAQGLTVVGVNIDEGQADEAVQRYVEGSRVSFPIWRDPQNRIAKRLRVLGVPETFRPAFSVWRIRKQAWAKR